MTGAVSPEQVLAALETVLDPELDRSIVELGFVEGVEIAPAEVVVALRLPTFWCAPNFSWLMAEDAREAVRRLGVPRVRVVLRDHHASAEISEAVSAGRSFAETFPADTVDSLDALRRQFRRKAFYLRQEALVRTLPAACRTADLRLGDLPDTPAAAAYRAVRAELGLACGPEALVFTDADGRVVGDLTGHLRRIRLLRTSLEANTALCRGLLETRYGCGASGGRTARVALLERERECP
jgi:metal-sulfur cluster biosynthetic enzyme